MIEPSQIEKLIQLIKMGYTKDILLYELEISSDIIDQCVKQYEIRRNAKDSIKQGNTQEAIEQLEEFIQTSDYNIVEKEMLIKLKAYVNKNQPDEEQLNKLEEERNLLGLTKNIDKILEDLNLQMPKRKSSIIRKSLNINADSEKELNCLKTEIKSTDTEKENIKIDYSKLINKYKKEIQENPKNSVSKRNLLAFTYFRAGEIDNAKSELMSLIDEGNCYNAYRQLVHIEIKTNKETKNYEDAKLWAYEALDKFPDSVDFRNYLITIARKEGNLEEETRILKEIAKINPSSKIVNERLDNIKKFRER